MRTRRLHVTGASGAGSTTLGRALANALALPHFDSDDFFWRPTNPPYLEVRPSAERSSLMEALFLPRNGWILSGSGLGWGDVADRFDLVVFLYAPTQVRLDRLRERESRRFGAEATAPSGWRHAETESFLDWAAHYDDGTREGRSLLMQLEALAKLTCPVLRLDGAQPVEELVEAVVGALE